MSLHTGSFCISSLPTDSSDPFPLSSPEIVHSWGWLPNCVLFQERTAFPLLASKAKSYRSKPITVSAQGTLSIDSSMTAETPLRMSVSGREVTLETAQSLVAQIFAMDGKIIWTKALSAGSAETLTLPQGAYILHAEGMDSVRLIIQ